MSTPSPPSVHRLLFMRLLRWRIQLRHTTTTPFHKFFHWKFSGVLIPFFLATAIGMAQLDYFGIANLFILAGWLWALGYWLTSDFLRAKSRIIRQRHVIRQHAWLSRARRSLVLWKWGVTIV